MSVRRGSSLNARVEAMVGRLILKSQGISYAFIIWTHLSEVGMMRRWILSSELDTILALPSGGHGLWLSDRLLSRRHLPIFSSAWN